MRPSNSSSNKVEALTGRQPGSSKWRLGDGLWTTRGHGVFVRETCLMDGFCTPPDDDEDPVMMLWRMENDARKRRRDLEHDAGAVSGVSAVVLKFRRR